MAYPLRTVDATPESSPEAETPATPMRPAVVPEASVWNADVDKWEISRKDEQGARDGETLLYRGDDGTLYSRAQFVAGVQEGPFVVYHRDGSVAREGTYVSGHIEGIVNAYASPKPGGEGIRNCCVPPGAARLCERYRDGEFIAEVFYDHAGRAILSDGRLCPARPAGLPEFAQFDESRSGWALRSRELDRFWSEAGALTEEVEHPREPVRTVRRFDDGGRLLQEAGFATDDRPHGPFFRRFSESDPSPYADPRIAQERGAFEAGQATGIWTFLDGDGAVVCTVDRGVAFHDGDDQGSSAFANAGGDWLTQARALAGESRVREALVAAARAALAAGDRAVFDEFRARHVVPVTSEREAQWGDALVQSADANLAAILDALICGVDAAAAFRALASVLPGIFPVATELVDAALLLAPERRATHLTRALLRFQHGDLTGALADADVVAGESTEAADSLRSYASLIFRGFDGWPGRHALDRDPALDGVEIALGHGIDDIRHAAGIYATRLGRVRTAVRALVGADAAVDWLPPDLSHLLPAGAVSLRRETVECEPDESADGTGAPETIEIDEQLVTDNVGVPALLTAAHADWAALSWLCWAVGLDGVALPDAVAPPADLALAMQMIVRRTWRIKDRLATGSLISRSQNVPGFEWKGLDIDALPRHLAEVAAAEYVAVRSMFLWLASDALSPFQDDLRDA